MGPRVNERIRISEVRLIGAEGEQLGILPTHQALEIARDAGLDLVEVSPTARPPVCKVMDFGRFQYEQSKKARSAKKKQSATELKEMRYRPKIDEHDFKFKTVHVREFLEEGHKVRAFVVFRGREMMRTEMGNVVLARVIKDLSDVAKPEGEMRLEGKQLSVILSPTVKKGKGKPKVVAEKSTEGPLADQLRDLVPAQAAAQADVEVESDGQAEE